MQRQHHLGCCVAGLGQEEATDTVLEDWEDEQQQNAAKGYMKGCYGELFENVLFVNAYAVSRNYGGPEEGGWYYDSGTPLASVPIPAKPSHPRGPNYGWELEANTRTVEKWINTLKKRFADVQDPRGRYSAIGGDDLVVTVEPCPARPFPAQRPHYE